MTEFKADDKVRFRRDITPGEYKCKAGYRRVWSQDVRMWVSEQLVRTNSIVVDHFDRCGCIDLGFYDAKGGLVACICVHPDWIELVDAPAQDKPALNNTYPHKCPRCGAPAYIGFTNIDCSSKCWWSTAPHRGAEGGSNVIRSDKGSPI